MGRGDKGYGIQITEVITMRRIVRVCPCMAFDKVTRDTDAKIPAIEAETPSIWAKTPPWSEVPPLPLLDSPVTLRKIPMPCSITKTLYNVCDINKAHGFS